MPSRTDRLARVEQVANRVEIDWHAVGRHLRMWDRLALENRRDYDDIYSLWGMDPAPKSDAWDCPTCGPHIVDFFAWMDAALAAGAFDLDDPGVYITINPAPDDPECLPSHFPGI